MWDLTSLAQKAKEAVATFENEINDSVGHVDETSVGLSNLFLETSAQAPAEETNEAEYFKVEEEEVRFDTDPSDKNTKNSGSSNSIGNAKLLDDSTNEGNGWDPCEDVNTLSEALSKVKSLEKENKQLQEELAAVKEEVKSYRVSNLELEQQVRDLTEENMSLKMNMAVKEDAD